VSADFTGDGHYENEKILLFLMAKNSRESSIGSFIGEPVLTSSVLPFVVVSAEENPECL
jgi:hypothetical protein